MLALIALLACTHATESERGVPDPPDCRWFDSDYVLVGEKHDEAAGRMVLLEVVDRAVRCERVPACMFAEFPHDAVFGGDPRLAQQRLGFMTSIADRSGIVLRQVDVGTEEFVRVLETRRAARGRGKRELRLQDLRNQVWRSHEMAYRILDSGCPTGVMLVGKAHLLEQEDVPFASIQDVLRMHGRAVVVLEAVCEKGGERTLGKVPDAERVTAWCPDDSWHPPEPAPVFRGCGPPQP